MTTPFARLLDQTGIDVSLVGDSASNVMAGHDTTLPITLDQMIYPGCFCGAGGEKSVGDC
jgi:3-methyl-2-oxobutanoate hydroxymethyltransferase